jgi:hypothetical protein
MSNPYEPLTTEEKDAHLANSSAGYNKPFASGEANFFDFAQTGTAALYNDTGVEITEATSGLFDRNGLVSPFSSGPQSRNYAITSFNAFNPYRHYIATAKPSTAGNDQAFKINISELLQRSTYNFNVYSTSFRTTATAPHSS